VRGSNNKVLLFFAVTILLVLSGIVAWAQGGGKMKLSTPEFEHNTTIPSRFVCRQGGVNPALVIEDIPENTKSLVLIIDDPDAPRGTFVHWVVYDIPITNRIEENSIPGTQGINNSGELNYCSPYPPPGNQHRYFFKVYALDTLLGAKEGLDKSEIENLIYGHILDKAEMIGLYKAK
jgi:hypothetical protein